MKTQVSRRRQSRRKPGHEHGERHGHDVADDQDGVGGLTSASLPPRSVAPPDDERTLRHDSNRYAVPWSSSTASRSSRPSRSPCRAEPVHPDSAGWSGVVPHPFGDGMTGDADAD
jgi:hypothetical protein